MTTVDLALLLTMGVLFAAGVYLLLERNLTRILLGVMLVNNAAILLLVVSAGGVGLAPIRVAGTDPAAYADTLPQALVLTAIVIGFAVTAFLAAMIYRSWLLVREDEVEADAEDARVARQPAWDPEDDADVAAEHSEFLDDAAGRRTGERRPPGAVPPAAPAGPRPGRRRPRTGETPSTGVGATTTDTAALALREEDDA